MSKPTRRLFERAGERAAVSASVTVLGRLAEVLRIDPCELIHLVVPLAPVDPVFAIDERLELARGVADGPAIAGGANRSRIGREHGSRREARIRADRVVGEYGRGEQDDAE